MTDPKPLAVGDRVREWGTRDVKEVQQVGVTAHDRRIVEVDGRWFNESDLERIDLERIDPAPPAVGLEVAVDPAPPADPDDPDSECQACDGTGDENASIDSDHCRVCRGTGRKWGSVIHGLTIEQGQFRRTIRIRTAERDAARSELASANEILRCLTPNADATLLARAEKAEAERDAARAKLVALRRIIADLQHAVPPGSPLLDPEAKP